MEKVCEKKNNGTRINMGQTGIVTTFSLYILYIRSCGSVGIRGNYWIMNWYKSNYRRMDEKRRCTNKISYSSAKDKYRIIFMSS